MNAQQLLNNPFINSVLKSKNPQTFVYQYIKSNPQLSSNPIMQNAMHMMETGDTHGIEILGRNLCREKGIDDIDSVVNQINLMSRH